MPRAAFIQTSARWTLAGLVALLTLAYALPLRAQTLSPFSGTSSGGDYKDPVQRAADAYSRGLKAKRKAEAEKDPEKRQKLFQKAKDELARSAGLSSNYDALVALGQVHLALGEKGAALQSCTEALRWKPNDPAALSCQTDARQKTVTTAQAGAPPSPPATGSETSPPR